MRAALDDEFRARPEQWWLSVQGDTGGAVHNTIDGGTQNGPVLQARDITNLTFDLRRE
ncbi:hypothetical protein ABZX95_21280 [Streptomyces sp. NPDC004232]|uniref:hypothetical protein n=1 Tax=unclassified Streptomyces TaxID=2593676 RepID=UPI0033A940C7